MHKKEKTWPWGAAGAQNQSVSVRLRLRFLLVCLAVLAFAILALDTSFLGRNLIGTAQIPWEGPPPKLWEDNWQCSMSSSISAVPSMRQWEDGGGVTRSMVLDVFRKWQPFGGDGRTPHLVIVKIVNRELSLVFARFKDQDYYRIDGLARALADVLYYAKKHFETLPNVEFLVNIADSPAVDGTASSWGPIGSESVPPLVFSTTVKPPYLDVMIPFPNSDTAIYKALLARTGVPWNARSNKLFWRGSPTDGNVQYVVGKWRSNPRAILVGMSFDGLGEDNDLIDAKFTTYIQAEKNAIKEMSMDPAYRLAPKVPLGMISNVKYAADLDGNTFTERTPSLMAQSAVVFRQDSPWKVFYSSRLKPWVHYIPLLRNVSDAKAKVEWARANDAAAKRIGENGRKFVMDWLTKPRVACYWRHLILEYAKVQAFKPDVSDFDDLDQKPMHVPSDEVYRSGWLREIVEKEEKEKEKEKERMRKA